MSGALVMLLGLMLEAGFGYPDAVYRRVSHPVVWLGKLITFGDKRLNFGGNTRRFVLGACVSLFTVVLAVLAGGLITVVTGNGMLGVVVQGLCAATLIAPRSLFEHVEAVAAPLIEGDLPAARKAVSMIVGRDPETLDEGGITRAALESLSENTGDGIVAPLFWGVIFGLPGIAGYKAINTLDSMIGYRNEKYEYFGKFAARLDDAANFIPARLTGILFAGASLNAYRVIWQDAGKHRSPNAGWAEAAFAARLGIRLSGPRVYEGTQTDDPYLNATGQEATPADLPKGLALFKRAVLSMGVILALLALA